MDSNNGHKPGGHKPALAFKQPANEIPIIGQPFTIKGWFPTVMLVCNCEHREPVMVPRGAGAQCPSCKRIFSIQQIVAPAGVSFGIGVAMPDESADATEGVLHG